MAEVSDIQNRIRNVLSGSEDAVKFTDDLTRMTGGQPQAKMREALKGMNLTGADLAKLTPSGYGAENLGQNILPNMNNLKALAHNTKQTFSGTPSQIMSNVGDALKRGLNESGGGMAMGVGPRARYLPMGAKLTAMTSAAPVVADALKKEDPTGKGRSQTERVGEAVGNIAGGLAGNLPHSVLNRLGMLGGVAGAMGTTMLGQYVGQKALGAAGKYIDKGVSSLRGVEAGDVTNQKPQMTQRAAGSRAV
jgi:hypothetical protein